ncbi:zf-HC2 domain-containing protein [Mucilaginibacter sp. OK283]|jgi:hypothetical protein|uniref:zf-HC2 domain-containing protein n=1 Tax=Mucilaginibacter sp. OK283 TaxID=1881049 RepID=UPI0008CDCA4F|nr:zf-HC2 domain-containing protein [Mucilaginibacter sp. OK283]SEO63499.1 Putative zinc-finger [Mucilaginibacter sp. OK283]
MKMNCAQYEEKFSGYISNELTAAERDEFEKHVSDCQGCMRELAEMQQVWALMGNMQAPEPGAHMELKFKAMLDTYKESVEESKPAFSIKEQIARLWQWQQRRPLAYSMLIVLVSFGAGYLAFRGSTAGKQDEQLKDLTSQVHELKQTMMLAMLENPSASERIKAVSYTSEIKHADKEVIDALFATLNNDPNVNVRLSTLDALTQLAAHPEVRQGLIASIVQQDSPLLQSAIADVMLKLQEKKSVNSFKELLKQKGLNPGVKDKIKQTITQLI